MHLGICGVSKYFSASKIDSIPKWPCKSMDNPLHTMTMVL